MPILNGLEYTASQLAVAYRASEAPQIVEIRLTTERVPQRPLGPATIGALVACINAGAAGGAEFSPSAGRARLVSGPRPDGEGALATRYFFCLELAAVSPRFLRTVVEALRTAGAGSRVTSLEITGELRPELDALSVREGQVRTWLDDPRAYPGQWPALAFPLREQDAPGGGVGVRATLVRPTDPGLLDQFRALLEIWQRAILHYVDPGHRAPGAMDLLPHVARGHAELSGRYDIFDYTYRPSRAVLLNLLQRFHQQVAPIAEVKLAMP